MLILNVSAKTVSSLWQLGQHMRNDFLKWRRKHQVRMEIERKSGETLMQFEQPNVYDRIVQSRPGRWHLPIDDGSWMCVAEKRLQQAKESTTA